MTKPGVRYRITTSALIALALSAAATTARSMGQEQAKPSTAAARSPTTAAEFDEVFKQVSNWGRWGKDDQLGAANLVTAAKRKQAVALVKDGTTVSLAHNVLTEKAEDNSNPI